MKSLEHKLPCFVAQIIQIPETHHALCTLHDVGHMPSLSCIPDELLLMPQDPSEVVAQL